MIKTVLAPGAPWPVHAMEVPAPAKPQPKPPKPKVTKPKSKIRRTNDNFDAWLEGEKKKAKP